MGKHGYGLHAFFVTTVLCLSIGLAAAGLAGVASNAGEPAGVFAQPDASASLKETSTGTESIKPGTAASTLRCIHYVEKDFLNSVTGIVPYAASRNGSRVDAGSQDETENSARNNDGRQARQVEKAAGGRVVGGIVPHHLLAGRMIARFFRTLSESSPETVILIGPNHKRNGTNGLHTSSSDWGTAFGRLTADRDLIDLMTGKRKAAQNDLLMEAEHSIAALVPYIKYYIPKAKIAPFLLHGNLSQEDSRKQAQLLSEYIKEHPGTVLIASVDFSHYLDAKTARKMDEITLKAIQSCDIGAIANMGNDHLDSPPSLMTLLYCMEMLGAKGPEVAEHGISSDITQSGADYTTSYYSMFYKNAEK